VIFAHTDLGWLTAGAVGGLVVVSLVGVVWPARVRFLLDRAIIVVLAIMGTAILVGALLPVIGPGPRDPLHFLYALAAPAVVGVARYLGRNSSMRRRAAYMTLASVVVFGIVYRLFSTG